MRKARPISDEAKISLKQHMKESKTKGQFQRIQCLWLRAELGLNSTEVARALGWHAASVKKLWSRYFTEGVSVLIGKGQGGRRRENLSLEQEDHLLLSFFEKAKTGGVLVVSEIKAAYEKAVGHSVPKSTIYRMLARHGWRKIAPRPRHPKSDLLQQEAFKKNFQKL